MKRLLVCVPGLTGSTTNWNPLLDRLRAEEAFKDVEILRFDHGCRLLSTKFASRLSDELTAMVNGECERQKRTGVPYDDICFIAHSLGALLTRRAYLLALLGDDRSGQAPLPWANRVSRIVLFAGINRGLFPSDKDAQKAPHQFLRWLLRRAVELYGELPSHLLAEDLLAGSDFVTNIRLSWIRTLRNLDSPPVIVQVLGTRDSIVTQNDGVDLDLTGDRITLAGANHSTVLDVEEHDKFHAQRYALILQAMFDTFAPRAKKEKTSEAIVFVVHGIRAGNTSWVRRAAELVKKSLPGATVVPATYGYFSALHFFLPFVRKKRTLWFKETYCYYLSREPSATFHVIGHSYGTYLLGYSLKRLPDMRFCRIVLAGSVLPKEFDWTSRLGKQVQEVWNHRSQRDVPVAILCSVLRGLGMKDIGTGGYYGFEAIPEIHEFCYYPGGHGAPLENQYLPRLVAELAGQQNAPCDQLPTELEWFSRLSRTASFFPYLMLLGVGVGLFAHFWFGLPTESSVLLALLLLCVIGMVVAFI
jgi:pimeloyl-ACP methyl ester carboxylesterase